jgi:hypothetical protein
MAWAVPAHASYAVSGAAWGDYCGSRTYYSSFAGTATADGAVKVDFTNFTVGAKATLPCGPVTQICINLRLTAHTPSGQPWATTAPFGTLTEHFQSKPGPIIGGNEAIQLASSCATAGLQSISIRLDANTASPFIYTGRYKLDDYRIETRPRILVGGVWTYGPWANFYKDL